MNGVLAGETVMGVRQIKLKHKLSIDMHIYAALGSLTSPWFSSPEFSANGLFVCCRFPKWSEAPFDIHTFRYTRQNVDVSIVRDSALTLLNKNSSDDNTFKTKIDCMKAVVNGHFSVPGSQLDPTTDSNLYTIINEQLRLPAATVLFIPYSNNVRLTYLDEVRKLAEEGRQLVLTIEITLVMREEPSPPSILLSCPTRCSASETLQKMLSEGLLPDVQLQLQDGVLPAHRAVLAACSPVFRAMFAHDMKERRSGQVDLLDVTLAAMEAAVKFIYGGELSSQDLGEDPELWMQVMKLADRYQLAPLKALCEAFLTAWVPKLPSELLLRLLVLADQLNAPDLRIATLSIIATSLRGEELDTNVRDLLRNYPDVAEKVMKLLLS